ncbi:SWI/SNF chromatin-remodeling complex subunit [Irineochytrium annulatum]|nr:SWI/SNF chromatin-remodeling complex subunit [Irineochytrium annulatum]
MSSAAATPATEGPQGREQLHALHLKVQQARENKITRDRVNAKSLPANEPLARLQYSHPKVRPLITFTEPQLEDVAQKPEALAPIRLDIDIDGQKIRDTFTWNVYEQFAIILCEDLKVPQTTFASHVAKAIQEQLDDFYDHSEFVQARAGGDGARIRPTRGNNGVDDGTADETELRVLIKVRGWDDGLRRLTRRKQLDITIDGVSLVDQFEWDINCDRNNPEVFADKMALELGLTTEFRVAIAHSIREQLQIFTKSLHLLEHPFDESPVDDEELATCFLEPIQQTDGKASVVRDNVSKQSYGPALLLGREPEVERLEKDRERDARYGRMLLVVEAYFNFNAQPDMA